MLVEILERAYDEMKESPPVGKFMSRPNPTCFVTAGAPVDFQADGEICRVLTPKGSSGLDFKGHPLQHIEQAAKVYKKVAVQIIKGATQGFLVINSKGHKVYQDLTLQIEIKSPWKDEDFGYLLRYFERVIGDPPEIKAYFFRDTQNLFVYEVGPEFFYQRDGQILYSYMDMLRNGTLSFDTLMSKIESYAKFWDEQDFPLSLVKSCMDWVVKETGGDSLVGQVDGTPVPGTTPGEGLQPTARLYKVSKMEDVPATEPYTDQVLVVFDKDLVRSARLVNVSKYWRTMTKWGEGKNVVLYLDGVAGQDEFLHYAKKSGMSIPIGICISSWAQLESLRKNPCKASEHEVVDIDGLLLDGMDVDYYRKAKIIPPTRDLIVELLKKGEATDVLYCGNYPLSVLNNFGAVRRVFTTGENFRKAVVALAIAKKMEMEC